MAKAYFFTDEWFMLKRVLCIGPHKAPSNAYIRTLAFEQIGCLVERIELHSKFTRSGFFARVRNTFFGKLLKKNLVDRIVNKIYEFSPDLIFIEKGLSFGESDLVSFRRSGPKDMKLVHLNPDDPFGEFSRGWDKFVSAIPFYDAHFVPKEVNRSDYMRLGGQSVFVYDRSFHPDFHRPIVLTEPEQKIYSCKVGFIGALAPFRETVLAMLAKEKLPLALWGNDWPKGKHWSVLKPYWRGGNQVGDSYAKTIVGMDVALHFVRRENRDLQDSRSFEIPACGSFMLAERTTDHERLFLENQEAVFFDTADECVNKCRYYLENEAERKMIANAGHQRVLDSGYDYASRLREMLEALESQGPVTKKWHGVR